MVGDGWRWVANELKPLLQTLPWLLTSTEQFVDQLRAVRLSGGETLARIDIKEFFMSGTADLICLWLSKMLDQDSPRHALLMRAVRWYLENQYIISAYVDGCWKVQQGTGMGLVPSSVVADLTLAALGDRHSMQPGARIAFGILQYWRFRDDILVLFAAGHKVAPWYRQFRSRCSPIFKTQLMEISSEEVTFLAVKVFRIGNRLHSKPREREVGLPLSHESGHPPGVLLSWPVGYAYSLRRLCTRDYDLKCCYREFDQRLLEAGYPPWLIMKFVDKRQREQSARPKPDTACVEHWCVLPWHPLWREPTARKQIQSFLQDPAWQNVLSRAWCDTPGMHLAKLSFKKFASDHLSEIGRR